MRTLLIIFHVLLLIGCTGKQEKKRMSWSDVCDKWSDQGYDALTEPEQVWLNTRWLIDAIRNGGLISFFYNSQANYYDDTTFALGKLEAFEALDILEAFAEFFGEYVPDDIDERNEIINSWAANSPPSKACENVDSALEPLLEKLEKTLDAYLVEHGLDPDYGF